MTTLEKVYEFHTKFEVQIAFKPTVDNLKTNLFRVRLLAEELGELVTALDRQDPVATLDALTDLQYVLDGAYLALGFGDVKERAFDIVHRSNMQKLKCNWPDMKIVKPLDWQAPDLSQLIQ